MARGSWLMIGEAAYMEGYAPAQLSANVPVYAAAWNSLSPQDRAAALIAYQASPSRQYRPVVRRRQCAAGSARAAEQDPHHAVARAQALVQSHAVAIAHHLTNVPAPAFSPRPFFPNRRAFSLRPFFANRFAISLAVAVMLANSHVLNYLTCFRHEQTL
jgi:hypothetical protein